MKKQAYMIATMIVVVTVISFSSAKAQTSHQTLTANIPFAFSVGDQTLPAGEYSVRTVNPNSDRKVLQLRSKDGRTNVLISTNNVIGKTRDDAKLVFNRYADRYFLAQAWMAADNIGMQTVKSRRERATEKEMASVPRRTETIALSRAR